MNSTFYYVIPSFISDYELVFKKFNKITKLFLKLQKTSTIPTSI
jgi:hypothetical protein